MYSLSISFSLFHEPFLANSIVDKDYELGSVNGT